MSGGHSEKINTKLKMKINQLQIEIDDLILRGECPVDIRKK